MTIISTTGQESLRRNVVAIMVNKRIWNAVLGCNLKNDRMISVHFQGKPFNIMVIQVHVPTSNAEKAEVERFYKDLQDLLELTPKTDALFIIGDCNGKVGSPTLLIHFYFIFSCLKIWILIHNVKWCLELTEWNSKYTRRCNFWQLQACPAPSRYGPTYNRKDYLFKSLLLLIFKGPLAFSTQVRR